MKEGSHTVREDENKEKTTGIFVFPATGGIINISGTANRTERYLNVIITAEEDHSVPFELRFYAKGDNDPRVSIRFGIMPRYLTNVPIDLNWLDGHILFPGQPAGMLKVVCHGSRIARKDVFRTELVSLPSFHSVRIKIDKLDFEDAPIPAASVPDTPIIDEMGQYIPKSWKSKTASLDELSKLLHREASLPDAYPFDDWSAYGGWKKMRITDNPGFFSKKKIDGRWFLCDPQGFAFFSAGPDCVDPRIDARVDGVRKLIQGLPDPNSENSRDLYRYVSGFGEAKRGDAELFSFERANLKKVFGSAWREPWERMVIGQLKRMGMNTIGNWSAPSLFGRMPYVTSMPRFPDTKHKIFRDFPDVLSPEYKEDAAKCAQALTGLRGDPFMIGYFLRNEPNWAFAGGLILAEEVLRDPEDTFCRRGLIDWLREKYSSVSALNRAWSAAFSSFKDLQRPYENISKQLPCSEADLREFSRRLVGAYVSIPVEMCRKADPNHMILGMRWAWISDPALTAGWENFDVFSINCYSVDPTAALDRVVQTGVDLPVMIGEFHFGALDAGLTATGLEAVTSQQERGKAYRYYTEHAAAHPNCVGCHYFQCYDQFALGRLDGENYNIGIFDVCMRPYPEMTEAIKDCSRTIYPVRSGLTPPTKDAPETMPMIAF